MNRSYLPVFTLSGADPRGTEERTQKLFVHVAVPLEGDGPLWGDPRPAQLDDLVLAVKRLSPEQQAYVARNLGLVPEAIGERLEAAEHVLDALADARLSIRRLDEYRARFPEQRDDAG